MIEFAFGFVVGFIFCLVTIVLAAVQAAAHKRKLGKINRGSNIDAA